MKCRKKPVVIEAMQYNWDDAGSPKEVVQDNIADFIGANLILVGDDIIIETLEGDMVAKKGDWIIKGVQGEFYPCKPDIFAATYEVAE
jgi:hypothetical protein